MITKTYLKQAAAAFCLLLTVHCSLLAQTGNPLWSLPPNYYDLTSLHSLPTNSYTWNQSGYAVQPGYGYTGIADGGGNGVFGPNNMYNDASGNPLFSIVSGYVFNPHGFLIDTLIDSVSIKFGSKTYWRGIIQGYSDACVVPNPNNCKQYYVFSAMPISSYVGTAGGGNSLWYLGNDCFNLNNPNLFVKPYFTCIDVSKSGLYMPSNELGLNLKSKVGAVGNATAGDLYKVTSTGGSGSCSAFNGDIHYAATTLYNKGGTTPYRLLFLMNDDQIITYKVTGTTVGANSTGVQWLNTYELSTLTSNIVGSRTSFINISELELYQDSANHKIKVAFAAPNTAGYASSNNPLVLLDFDTLGNYNTGTSRTLYTSTLGAPQPFYIKGVEFSPNGNYVFITHSYTTNYPSSVDRVTYSTTATSTVSVDGSFQDSQIEKGTDGNLYLVGTTTTTPSMAKITNPNSTTPGFTPNVLSLSGGYDEHYVGGQNNWTQVFTLPDQIDQDVYGSNFNTSNTACCLFYSVYDKQYYSAGQTTTTWTTTATTQTWTANSGTVTNNPIALSSNTTSTVTIGGELRIPAGKTITITNMTLKFSPQARLIIENGLTTGTAGGKLILNNCILTVDNRCGIIDMWPGVQVWGSPSLSQIPTNQGFLVMNSGTVIQNAYVGVLAGYDSTWLSHITSRPPYSLLPTGCSFTQANSWNNGANSTQGQGGAIIQGVSATFLNNQRHAVYLPYALPASAGQKLQTCTFSINAALLASGVTPTHFVEMYTHTNTFPINGCSFICNYSSYNFTTTGLWTSNSAYAVDQYSPTRSTFNNFLYGIYSTDAGGSTATIWCKNSTFTSNKVSIYLGNVNNAIVENDTMKIFASSGGGNCTGLYLDNCTGYYVQDNNFTKGSGSTANNKYGVLVNNSGYNANAIFRNSFDNIYKGSQAQYRNYSAVGQNPNATGLIYLCNTFSVSTISGADIYVPAIGSSANVGGTYTGSDTASGICNTQGNAAGGSLNRPTADNQFSHTTGGHDFYIESGHALASYYTYFSATAGACGTTTAYFPININSAKVFPVCNSSLGSTPPSCLSGNTGHRTMYVNPITQAISDAASYKHMYDSLSVLVDGGSTSGLLNLVTGNNNTQAVYNSLNAAAPYLSNAVLKSYINSNYPANDISKILSACSPLSDDVNNTLSASNLSAGIKTQIAVLQTGDVAKIDALNNGISSAFTGRQLSFDAAIRILVRISDADTIVIANALQKEKAMDLPARVQVETGLNIHDSAFAANALAKVKAADGNTNYVKLSTILLHNISKSASQIMQNTSYVNQMLAFDKDSTDRLTYLKANLLLQTIGKSDYQPYIQEDVIADSTDNNKVVRHAKQTTTTLATSLSSLYNSPNPFTESTTVKATIVEKTQNAFIVITDMVGNEVARYAVQQGENNINVNADGLNQAVMFCTLVVDGIKIKTNKMVLIK